MLGGWLQRQRFSLGAGLAVVLAITGLHGLRLTEPLEWLAYDHAVRHFSRMPASPDIVHIDINDDALKRVSSWPWPRDLQAALIAILHELGAERILVDLVWSEPKGPEIRVPESDPWARAEEAIEQVGQLSAGNVVYGDDELRGAIAAAGNVFPGMYYEEPEAVAPGGESALAATVAAVLERDFALDAGQIAGRLGLSVDQVNRVLAGAKRQAGRKLVAHYLATRPAAAGDEVLRELLPSAFAGGQERLNADRRDIQEALWHVRGLQAVQAGAPPVPERLKGRLPRRTSLVPPLEALTRAARGTGFVNFQADADGMLRHLPLLVEWDGRVIEQLGFAAARDALGIRLEDLEIRGGTLIVAPAPGRPEMRLQLDGQGRILLHWHAAAGGWPNAFIHVPVARILRLWDLRERIRENEVLRQIRLAQAVEAVSEPAGFEAYRAAVAQMLREQRALHLGRIRGSLTPGQLEQAERRVQELVEAVRRRQQEAVDLIRQTWAELAGEPDPQDPALAAEYRRFQSAHRLISGEVRALEEANAAMAAQEPGLLEELRPLMRGRTCLVGYTATAVADMVATPAFGRTPGVMIHSNLLNSFLQGRFLRWMPLGGQVLVVLLVGLAVMAGSARLDLRFSPVVLGLLIAGWLWIDGVVLFSHLDFWMPPVTVCVQAFVTWAVIVLTRYLVVERQRRRFSRAVAQYVSPAMARRLAESAGQLDFSPSRSVVSCFFSDLAGFTAVSEQLGPEGTRTVLNPYLEAMSRALHARGALINKFMGDGVFAFFNPPILPCPGHEQACCEAALDCLDSLEELKRRFAGHRLAAYFRKLAMRIGAASGAVFVGDYGSENKLDYTCVGDVVNLAARLESANKQFGTVVMVDDATRAATDGSLVFRDLGIVQVAGQSVGVRVHELLGRSGRVDTGTVRYAGAFGEAVGAFIGGDFAAAVGGFEACLQARPGDKAAVRYLEVARAMAASPPPDAWRGVLELTEK